MAEKKIIAITGATGAQGGGLARAILGDPNSAFAVRALTRNPDSDKAKELAALGAEVVAVDVDDAESLNKAFEGAYGAFCVTFFWEHYSPEKEIAQVKNMAEAAKAQGVQHVVWSTLEDTRNWVPLDDDRMPTLMEKYKVPHFDGKGEADAEFARRGVPTTCLLTSFYWDNFIHFGLGPKKGEDGNFTLALPMGDAKLPGIAAEDIGKCAYGVFKQGSEFIGKTIGIAGGHPTGQEMAQGLSRGMGETVNYYPVPPEVFRGFGFPGSDDLGNMFQFKQEFESDFCSARDLDFSRSLNAELMSFDQWIDKYGSKIPKE